MSGLTFRSCSGVSGAGLVFSRIESGVGHSRLVEAEDGRDDAEVIGIDEEHRIGLFARQA